MKTIFGFCLRFFVSFVVAKLLLRSLEADRVGWLIGLSLIITANLYWFDLSKYSDRLSRWRAEPDESPDRTPPGKLQLPAPKNDR
jgi:hypothetical protein